MSEKYHAFAIEYDKVCKILKTEIEVVNPFTKERKTYSAMWDTGATDSVIVKKVYDELNLFAIDRITVQGVNSVKDVDVAMIDIILPNKIIFPKHRVTVCEMNDIDMLIGMDIISKGDFSISNFDGKTLFSFSIPPFENRINLLELSKNKI